MLDQLCFHTRYIYSIYVSLDDCVLRVDGLDLYDYDYGEIMLKETQRDAEIINTCVCTVCAGCNEINANKICSRGIPSLGGNNARKQQGTAVLHSHVNNNMHAQSNIARVVLP